MMSDSPQIDLRRRLRRPPIDARPNDTVDSISGDVANVPAQDDHTQRSTPTGCRLSPGRLSP